MSDLDNILDGVEAVEPEKVEPEQEATQEAKEPEQAEAQAKEPEQKEPESEPKDIPYPVFKSTRDDLKSQLDEARAEIRAIRQQVQPKSEPEKVPDVLEDQDGFARHVTGTVQQAITQQKLQMSRYFAERDLGKETVAEAIEYFNQHPQMSGQFLNEASPFHAAVDYVKAQRTAQEIGNDPAAYRAKLEAEIRQKIEAEMAAKQVTEMAKAPSMAKTNGSGGVKDPGWSGPTDLDALIGE